MCSRTRPTTEMDTRRVDAIRLPSWYDGLHPNHRRGVQDYRLLAFDTETAKGYPYTLQTTDGTTPTLWYLRPRQFLPRLLKQIETLHPRSGRGSVVVAGFNLAYDLPAILYPNAKRFAERTFMLRCRGAEMTVFYGRVPFAKVRYHQKTVWVIDLFAFVWCSLAKAAAMFHLPVQKRPKPAHLGDRVLRSRAFESYALADVEATWHLGQRILALHREFDVRLCVSIAQLAGRVFLHHFLTHPIPAPPREVLRAALLSYHGGKNGFYLPAPAWVPQCREYDLRSAYPWAMTQIPSMSRGHWKKVTYVDADLWGFYQVSGTVQHDPYPALYDDTFRPLGPGRVDSVWVTSCELHEALRRSEIELSACVGWVWEPCSHDRPLADFVGEFYRRKQTATTPQEREIYKLMLNSLYGKFIQLNEEPDGTERPGALFHPVLASWITGLVRARMHRLEHDAAALHTATDAVHTTRVLETGPGLGDLEETQRGPALLIRNKVYLHFAEDGSSLKYATHGIHLSAEDFWRRLVRGQRTYRALHLLRPVEAARSGQAPLRPIMQPYRMHLGDVPMEDMPEVARTFFTRRTRGHADALEVSLVGRRGGGRVVRRA